MRPIFLLLLILTSPPIWAAGPGKDFEYSAKHDFVSPDRKFMIRQYHDADWSWQIWVYPKPGTPYLLAQDHYNDYPAGFQLSSSGRHLLRAQKIGSGTHTLYLYEQSQPGIFSLVGGKPFGTAAWEFFASFPGIDKEQVPTFHEAVGFSKWDGDRYLYVSLSGVHFTDIKEMSRWIVDDWMCRFDLQKRRFEIDPAEELANKKRVYFLTKGS